MYTNINLYIFFIVLFLLFNYYLFLSLQCPVVLGFHILSYLNNRDIHNNYITKILRKLNYMSSANSLGISLTHNWLSLCMCICVSVCVCIDICCLLHLTVLYRYKVLYGTLQILHFYRLKICGNPASDKSICTVFAATFACSCLCHMSHFGNSCNILNFFITI